jgi:hypothetical protein
VEPVDINSKPRNIDQHWSLSKLFS